MTEQRLAELEEKLRCTVIGTTLNELTEDDIAELIAEVRRLQEIIEDDNAHSLARD